jgi:hypothetical protein
MAKEHILRLHVISFINMQRITHVKIISTESTEPADLPVNFSYWRNKAEMISHNLGL